MQPIQPLSGLGEKLWHSVVESTHDAEPKMLIFGLFGLIGFPSYYWIWTYLFPQPYENLPLRIVCLVISAPALLIHHWPKAARPYIPVYWYLATILYGPFFFFFLLLQNHANTVWSGSFLASILLAILLFDILNALIVVLIGVSLGFLAHALFGNGPIPWENLIEQTPVYAFTIVGMGIFSLQIARERRAKIEAATAMGGHIAHELRTPLATIRAVNEIMGQCLASTTISGNQQGGGRDVTLAIPKAQMSLLSKAPTTVLREIDHMSMVIDLTLANTGIRRFQEEDMVIMDSLELVQTAIARYPFKDSMSSAWVRVESSEGIAIRVVPSLFYHVIFNLLKNSIWSIRAAGRGPVGEIRISSEPGSGVNRLYIRDNGQGIPPRVMTRIFSPFFSTRQSGTGLGLHFCRSVMQRFGGDIRCRSEPGRFTEMVLEFPQTAPLR